MAVGLIGTGRLLVAGAALAAFLGIASERIDHQRERDRGR